MKFTYIKSGTQAKGEFKYVVVTKSGRTMFFHRKSDFKDIQGTKYQWNKEAQEYQEMK